MQNYTEKIRLLSQAITANVQVMCEYKTVTEGTNKRLINPHCIYLNKTGTTMLDAWQVTGHSESGVNEQFKQFAVYKMSSIELSEVLFKEDSKFNHNSTRYENALCRIGG